MSTEAETAGSAGPLRGEMLGVWTGLFSMVFFIFGWAVCYGWLFPPHPSLPAQDVADIYQNNAVGMRLGSVIITNFGAPLTVSFAAIITVYMLKMKGVSPVLAWTQLASGAVNALIFIIPASIYGAMGGDRAGDPMGPEQEASPAALVRLLLFFGAP